MRNSNVIERDKFVSILREATANTEKALAHNRAANAILKGAAETYGLDLFAVSVAKRMTKIDDSERCDTIRSLIIYWYLLGFFDEPARFGEFERLASLVGDIMKGKGETATPSTDKQGGNE